MTHHLISLAVFFPLLGTLFQMVLPASRSRWSALAASLTSSVCGLFLVLSMQAHTPDLQATELFQWVGSYAITYDMAVDGLNALLVLLISFLFPILIAAEWNQKTGVRGIHSLFLILQSSFIGAVCAQDLFLLFFFWGVSALPFYFLVGIWGGKERERAAFRGIVSSSLGNAAVFAALVLIYYAVDPHTFSLRELSGGKLGGKVFELLGHELSVSTVAFVLMSIGLSLRAPIWPLHGWFTEVASEAPPTVFVALSAGAVPIALYIFVKVCYLLFPELLVHASQYIVGIGMINLVMGGLCALSQRGLSRLLAFICLSEVGIVLMGVGSLNSAGVVGAVYQQLVLGLGLAGFGLSAGVIAERTGHSDFLNDRGERTLGGIANLAPLISIVAGVVIASILGFPGFGGFVGHALVIIGSYSIHPLTVVVAAGALLLAAFYLFSMYRSVFLGSPGEEVGSFSDLTLRERAYLVPLVFTLLFLGIYPKPLIELIRPTVLTLLSAVK